MFAIKLLALLALSSILFIEVKSEDISGIDKSEGRIPTNNINPCAYTDCIANSTCISIIDPETCQPGPGQTGPPCEKKAICIPSYGGNPGIYCGPGGDRCTADQKCDFVAVECFAAPCPPVQMCTSIIPNLATRMGSTNTVKFTKFVVGNNNVYFHQRQKGRPLPAKQTSFFVNKKSK